MAGRPKGRRPRFSPPGPDPRCAPTAAGKVRPMSTDPTVADPPVQFNLYTVFETLAETLGDRECFVWRDRRLSYAQLAERARRLAAYLHGRGLGVHTARDLLAGHESGQDHVALALYNG